MFNKLSGGQILVFLMVVSFFLGWQVNGWRMGSTLSEWKQDLAEAQLEAKTRADELTLAKQQAKDLSSRLYAAEKAALEAEGRVVIKKVIEYVKEPYSGRCDLPNSWVRIDTEAATGMPPDAESSSGADGAPSGFTDIDALQVITDRSLICRAEIAKLRGLQDFVRNQYGDKR